jgi:quercetin dioxygenase-like cupin family protein
MSNQALPAYRFVSLSETEVERLPGKTHHWYCKPGMVRHTNLLFVRAHLQPGHAHPFHYHPGREEILYILSGRAEQWVEREKRMIGPGDSLYLPPGIVHGTYNTSSEVLDFLAVISPADAPGAVTIEMADQPPWNSVRPFNESLKS